MRYELKYGCNPHQRPAYVEFPDGALQILNGTPGYINFLDALHGWQLVKELSSSLGLPAAASFKHVSPAGAAVGLPLGDALRRQYLVEQKEVSPLCCAYIRARGADRLSSFGDFIALSEPCDVSTAQYIAGEVSDGIIAPGYQEEALAILKRKRKGAYTILMIDPEYRPGGSQPQGLEARDVFGFVFAQQRDDLPLTQNLLQHIVTEKTRIPSTHARDLLIALIALKYTQSNSVCYAADGQAIGVGAGQQSRIHCTRLAGDKADLWHLRRHPQVLALPFLPGLPRPARDNAIDLYLSEEECDTLLEDWQSVFSEKPARLSLPEKREHLSRISGVSLASDAFFPFGDNIRRAARSGVSYIAQPGGSIRDEEVIAMCDKLGIAMAFTGVRLFHH